MMFSFLGTANIYAPYSSLYAVRLLKVIKNTKEAYKIKIKLRQP